MEPTTLTAIHVADEPLAWERAGFTVAAGVVHLGGLAVVLGAGGEGGVVGWSLDPATESVDGLPVLPAPAGGDDLLAGQPAHANTATALDHLVIGTPAPDRTTAALEALGWSVRRSAAHPTLDRTMRFLVVPTPGGRTVLEVMAPSDPRPDDRPARFWGLAVTVDDLDAAVGLLGPDHIGQPRDAVQPGRRIATVRGDRLGISVPLALMSPRP